MRRYLFLLPCLFVLLPAASQAGDEKPKDVIFKSEAGKFSVALPHKPDEETAKVPFLFGELDMHLYHVDVNDNATYTVAYADSPKGSVTNTNRKQIFDGIRERYIKTMNGKLVWEKNISLGKQKVEGANC